jgi:hypothetical protein
MAAPVIHVTGSITGLPDIRIPGKEQGSRYQRLRKWATTLTIHIDEQLIYVSY